MAGLAHILIVERDSDIGQVLATALAGFGHCATWVHEAAAGLESLRRERIDAVLIDTASPGTTDAEALASYAASFGVPVILMSTMADGREPSSRLPYPILCKPFPMAQLQAVLGEELEAVAVFASDDDHELLWATAIRLRARAKETHDGTRADRMRLFADELVRRATRLQLTGIADEDQIGDFAPVRAWPRGRPEDQ